MLRPMLASTLAAAAHAQVTLTDYGAPAALSFQARGVSSDGSKVLGFLYVDNCFLCTRAFTMDAPNQFTYFDATTGRPGQQSAEPMAISRDGAVLAGVYGADYSHLDRSLRWSNGAAEDIPGLQFPDPRIVIKDMDDSGRIIVGQNSSTSRAFRWTPETGVITLHSFNDDSTSDARLISADGSTIIGSARVPGNASIAVAWRNSDYPEALSALGLPQDHTVEALSADGTVLVGSRPTGNDREIFRWRLGSPVEYLGVIPVGSRRSGHVAGVSEDGDAIVGSFSFPPGPTLVGFLWTRARGMQDLRYSLFTRHVDVSRFPTLIPAGISADGRTIVGSNNNAQFQNRLWRIHDRCPADFNDDGFSDFFDYDAFVVAFETGDPAADFNQDGFADFFDYDAFVTAFETGC